MTISPDALDAFSRRFARAALIAPRDSLGLSTEGLIRSCVATHLTVDDEARERASAAHFRNVMSAYGRPAQGAVGAKPFPMTSGGTAIIPVHGVLVNRFNYALPYATGYNALRYMLNAAVADADVQRIVFDVNSPGGQVAGLFELAADIRAAREVKPVHAVVDSMAFSAAYAIASAATDVTMAPSAEAGSIGVVAMHMNIGPALKEMGIEVTFIYAGKHKVDGNPYEALSDEVRAAIQADVNRSYETFVQAVAAGRRKKMDADAARRTEARCYGAEDCIEMGLADRIAAPDAALLAFESGPAGDTINTASSQKEITDMDIAEARAAERARMAGILGHPEAAGRESLARHLAENTDMTVEQAGAALAAAPKADASPQRSPLDAAMDRTEQPDVGANGGDPVSGKEESKADRLWASFQAATGDVVKTH